MSDSHKWKRPLRYLLAGLGLFVALGVTGCQVDLNGKTLPSPYYFYDDVQYFPPGPEFKLEREASALREAKAQENLQRR